MRKWIIILILLSSISADAQFIKNFGTKDTILNSGKARLIGFGVGGIYAASTTALSILWYDSLSGFRFFNDNPEWRQIDKVGHATVAFHQSRLSIDLLKWAGIDDKKAVIIGGLGGFIMQTPIEILDGFSPSYGASWGDIVANTSGAGLVVAQELLWDDIYIQPKYSFHRTPYAKVRPNTLGSSWNEEMLKDYNGQTLWLSGNIYPLLNKESKFPKWINIAIGYGAYDMQYGSPEENQLNGHKAYRQWYISPDFDLTKIPTKKKGIKALLYSLNVIKFPLPALQYDSKGGIQGHFFYF